MRDCMDQGVELALDEVQRLTDLPYAAHQVKAQLLCELEHGHAGPHLSLAQSQDHTLERSTPWWLRWTADTREWNNDSYCSEERGELAELCTLPVGHEGCHRWT